MVVSREIGFISHGINNPPASAPGKKKGGFHLNVDLKVNALIGNKLSRSQITDQEGLGEGPREDYGIWGLGYVSY